ncbi:MAG TPA: TolC family outer membrane protein [Caulobacteraceae bacterium]|nr:TolC family outer membrane protein [Caulobacteraceae bacterium]
MATAIAAAALPAASETLGEAILAAYQTNPTLQAQRAALRALDETYVQARAGYNPSANAAATITTNTNNNPGGFTQPLPGQSQPLVPGDTQTSGVAVVLTQPLYTGGRVAAQVGEAQAQILAGREQLRATEQSVLGQVVLAYADVLRDQEEVAVLEADHDVLQHALAETRARTEVGELTRTDLALVDARIAAADAQLAQVRSQYQNSRAEFAQVVGHPPATLAPPATIDDRLPTSLETALTMARDAPAVRQAVFTEQASFAKIAEAKAARRPTLALQGVAGYSGGALGLHWPFAHYTYDLSASAVLSTPLFTGGLTSSQIRQAAETNAADRINIEGARRLSQFQVAEVWDALTAARVGVTANQAQVAASSLAFRGMVEESRDGDRSVFDAMLAQQSYSAAQIALVAAQHDAFVAGAALLADLGRLDVTIFAPEVKPYDPRVNFDRVRHAWPFAPWSGAIADVDRIGALTIDHGPGDR